MQNITKGTSYLSIDVDNLCSPLYSLGIRLFHFVRIFNDNSRFSLCNDPELVDFIYTFYVEKYTVNDAHYVHKIKSEDSCIINFEKNKNTIANFEQLRNNLFYDAYLYKNKKKHYTDFVYYSSQNKNNYELYLNQTSLFERFYYFFLDKGSKLLEEAKASIVQPKVICPKFKIEINQLKSDFIHNTVIERFYIDETTYLTKRECECLSLVGDGKSYEEIARYLHISTRTIINHIENIKLKTSVKNINELVKFSLTNNFPTLFHSS